LREPSRSLGWPIATNLDEKKVGDLVEAISAAP
jgi:hypothetical protein